MKTKPVTEKIITEFDHEQFLADMDKYKDNSSLKRWLRKKHLTESNVYFSFASLFRLDLSDCNFSGIEFISTNFDGCYMNSACFIGASFIDCKFTCASFVKCDFRNATFKSCNMMNARISGTNFTGADFGESCFTNADILKGNRFGNVKMLSTGLHQVCPDTGAFDAWKYVPSDGVDYLIHLRIPEDAKRSSATSRSCRCSKAMVISITDIRTGKAVNSVVNMNLARCVYQTGKMVKADAFDKNRWNESSHGINFFITKDEALEYAG